MLLAQCVDTINMLRWELAARNRRKGQQQPPMPKPIPRPGVKQQGQKVGRDPIPVSEFKAWWASKAIEQQKHDN